MWQGLKRWNWWLLSLLGTAWLCLPASGQQVSETFDTYVAHTWGTEEGLPHSAVTALLQTQDGYLWIGTAAGLARFDGHRFVVMSDERAPHLSHSYIWALHEDTDGTLWVGMGDGLAWIRDDGIGTFTVDEGLPVNFVRALARDADDRLWVGTYGGGVCHATGHPSDPSFGFTCGSHVGRIPGRAINDMKVDAGGNLWVSSAAGLSRWMGDRFVAVAGFDDGALTFSVSGESLQWVGTGEGLFAVDDEGIVPTLTDGQPLGAVRSIFQAPDGLLWVGTESHGVFCLRDRRLVHFQNAMLAHRDVRVITRDREGSLWIGTNGGGLTRLREGRVRIYATEEGLPSDVVNSILEDRQGSVWLATGGGLVRLDGSRMTTFTVRDGLPAERILSLAEDHDGGLWVGTNGGGLARLVAGRFTAYTAADGLPGDVIFGLHVDRHGRVWIGGQGLARWTTGDTFERIGQQDGLAAGIIVVFAEEADGTLWFGSDDGGLSRYRNGRFTTYTTVDGLPSNSIRALHVDAAGGLWIGTRGGGLTRFIRDEFQTISSRQGLPDDIVFHIREDDDGSLWINTARSGLARLLKAELEAVLNGESDHVSPLLIGRGDGMRSVEGVGGFHPSGLKSRDGRLWFPTHRGVAVIDPAGLGVNRIPPPVYIEEVYVDYERVAIRDGLLTLRPGAKHLEIRYTGLNLSDPARVRFRTRLEGQDADWRDAASGRSRTFDNLSPGTYTFMVAAANPDGVWNAVPAALDIRVIPPWWRTRGALLVWFVLIAAGIHGLVRWRVWQLRRRNRELETLVAARTAQVKAQSEALLELDRLKSHFFANLSHEFGLRSRSSSGPWRISSNARETPPTVRLSRACVSRASICSG
jgi:ligand-binding sensor domain-containing protein